MFLWLLIWSVGTQENKDLDFKEYSINGTPFLCEEWGKLD